jgi:methenyltetrahydromethanopterin cyclohydrolase
MISLNKRAMKVVRQIVAEAESLRCKVVEMKCGATLIDMGLECPGGWEAGLLFTRVSIGDLGLVQYGTFKLDEHHSFASADVLVDDLHISCLGAQIAGWKLGMGEYAVIGSGPARALAVVPTDEYFRMTDYRDDWHEAVLCIQDIKYPTDEIALEVARACRVEPQNLYLLFAPTTSTVTSVQVSARILEQTAHKLFEKGFDGRKVLQARGTAPVAPVCKDELKTMGRINDALIYGSEVELWVDASDAEIQKLLPKIVSITDSPNYGEMFEDIFVKAGKDFYMVDHDVHSIAKLQVHNVNSGRAFWAGEINYELLQRSFLN